jgi:hypothetical protein
MIVKNQQTAVLGTRKAAKSERSYLVKDIQVLKDILRM